MGWLLVFLLLLIFFFFSGEAHAAQERVMVSVSERVWFVREKRREGEGERG
jgi:hypothetical protein